MILIEGNFYVGRGGASDVNLDRLIYLHIGDADRLRVRFIRDLTDGQSRGKNPEEIFEQFTTRQKTQDIPYTIPFMSKSDLILFVKPELDGDFVKNFSYVIYKKKRIRNLNFPLVL